MAMYDRQWFLDVRAVLDTANSLKQTPPQDVIEPKPEPSPAYSYSSGDLSDQPDYGMYAGFTPSAHEFVVAGTEYAYDIDTAPSEYLATSDFDPA